MLNDDGTYTTTYGGIADMITAQLGPTDGPGASSPMPMVSGFDNVCESEIVGPLDWCPKDSAPGPDRITNTFLR